VPACNIGKGEKGGFSDWEAELARGLPFPATEGQNPGREGCTINHGKKKEFDGARERVTEKELA